MKCWPQCTSVVLQEIATTWLLGVLVSFVKAFPVLYRLHAITKQSI